MSLLAKLAAIMRKIPMHSLYCGQRRQSGELEERKVKQPGCVLSICDGDSACIKQRRGTAEGTEDAEGTSCSADVSRSFFISSASSVVRFQMTTPSASRHLHSIRAR